MANNSVKTNAARLSREPEKEMQRRAPGSGKVTHDARGTAVWDWAIATGVLAGSKRADLLQILDNPELEISGEELELADSRGGDPYNRS